MLVTVLAISALGLHLAIAAILVRRYLRTRDAGFIWLGVAVVIWPLLSRMLEAGEKVLINRIAHHQSVRFYPFSLIEGGQGSIGSVLLSLTLVQQLIGVCLLLVAVIYLSKTKSEQLPAAN